MAVHWVVYTISVQEISKDAVMVTAKACELLVLDLTLRALHNMNDRGRTSLTVCFDFLVYVYTYMRNIYCIYILHTLHIHIYIHKYKRAYLYIRTYTPTIYILHTTYIKLIHACMQWYVHAHLHVWTAISISMYACWKFYFR